MPKEKTGIYAQAVREAEQHGVTQRQQGEGMVLHQYPSYETYVEVQTAGNRAKLKRQFVKKSHVAALAEHLRATLGTVGFGLCHGTRAGREQRWFRKHLPGAEVIGTEISDTATEFPHTVQWDFHAENPDWVGRADFVYSNSWDHAFDPERAFTTWIRQLRPGGRLLLDYTAGQAPHAANALDPFGIELQPLEAMLKRLAAANAATLGPRLDLRDNKEYRALVLTVIRDAA